MSVNQITQNIFSMIIYSDEKENKKKFKKSDLIVKFYISVRLAKINKSTFVFILKDFFLIGETSVKPTDEADF